MAGVTNAPFRSVCRRFGAGLYVSEMITARALVEGNAKTRRLASFAPDEAPRSLQLYGVDPEYVGKAVEILVAQDRVDHVDLNFGCPVRKVTRQGRRRRDSAQTQPAAQRSSPLRWRAAEAPCR